MTETEYVKNIMNTVNKKVYSENLCENNLAEVLI